MIDDKRDFEGGNDALAAAFEGVCISLSPPRNVSYEKTDLSITELLGLDTQPAGDFPNLAPPPPPKLVPPKPPRLPARAVPPVRPPAVKLPSSVLKADAEATVQIKDESVESQIEEKKSEEEPTQLIGELVEQFNLPKHAELELSLQADLAPKEENAVAVADALGPLEEAELPPSTGIHEVAPSASFSQPPNLSEHQQFLLHLIQAKSRSDVLLSENKNLRAELEAGERLDAGLLRAEAAELREELTRLQGKLAGVEAQAKLKHQLFDAHLHSQQLRVDAEVASIQAKVENALADARMRETTCRAEIAQLRAEKDSLTRHLADARERVALLEHQLISESRGAAENASLVNAAERLVKAIESRPREASRPGVSGVPLPTAAPTGPTVPPAPQTATRKIAPPSLQPSPVDDYSAFFDQMSGFAPESGSMSTPGSGAKREVRNIFKKA